MRRAGRVIGHRVAALADLFQIFGPVGHVNSDAFLRLFAAQRFV
jgi:hypothetical protein